MYCQNCGKEIDDKAEICVGCGVRVNPPNIEGTGIIKKLGKKGIPGFRSGKTWKMVIATFGYSLIFIILLAIISGSPEKTPLQQAPQEKAIVKTTIPPMVQPPKAIVKTPIPTPVPTPQAKVIIEHFATPTNKLTKYILSDGPEYQYPSPGMTYLIMNMKITNQGYQMISINQFIWSLKVSTTDNPNAYIEAKKEFQGEPDGVVCPNTELENGGWVNCKVAFEAPSNFAGMKLYMMGADNANIEWVKK